jgi:recombination protein RecT
MGKVDANSLSNKLADNRQAQKETVSMVKENQLSLSRMLAATSVKGRFEELLGKKAPGFISSIISVANNNDMLKTAEPSTIISSAVIAATLDLPINQNLGFAYIVPYNNKKAGKMEATFQIGYRGYIQLAMRTGLYENINATEVYEGEIKSYNRITGRMEFDMDAKTSDKVVGYVAYFKLLNGFEKYLYMTKEQVKAHGARYSQSFNSSYGRWQQDFDSMAIKTVLKRLLNKYGILSIEMQKAFITDDAVVNKVEGEDIDVTYVDNPEYTIEENPGNNESDISGEKKVGNVEEMNQETFEGTPL